MFFNSYPQHWHTPLVFRHKFIHPTLLSCLLEQGSLTKLLRTYTNALKVKVMCVAWQKPYFSEANFMDLAPNQFVYVREVEILCHNEPWIIARTIIPKKTLLGKERKLLHLGNTPLGDYIFSHPNHERTHLQLTSLNTLHLSNQNICSNKSYARRSIFLLNKKPLLVTEIFTPLFIQTLLCR